MFHSILNADQVGNWDLYELSQRKFETFVLELKNLGLKFCRFEDTSENKVNGVSITFDDGYKDNLSVALPFLSKHQIPFTVFVVSDFLGELHDKYLSEAELIELSQSPWVNIGAHGKTHRPLTEMGLEEAREELKLSKERLESLIGRPVTTMSFPHGCYNSELIEVARSLGYTRIGTSDPRPNEDSSQPQVSRQCIYSCDTLTSFRQKVLGLWDWVW